MVEVLVGGIGLEHVLPQAVPQACVEEVVVVDGSGGEIVLKRILLLGVLSDVF